MSIRLRITSLFTLLVFVILGLVCTTVYYISSANRINNFKTRLTNSAITTANLLSQSVFNAQIIQRINAATTVTLRDKTIQVYDRNNHMIYRYSDNVNDTIPVAAAILAEAREKQNIYFITGNKEAVAHLYINKNFSAVVVSAAYDEGGKQNLNQLRIILLLSFLGGIVVAFAGGYLFSAGLLRPIRKIADEVNEISAQNFTRRIYTGSVQDEWYYLAYTLNELLDRLQESFELQRRFIANASHELSTPLTSISSQLEVSLQRHREANEYRKVMKSIHQDVRYMSKLTQTLLEFAKASGSAGGLEINLIRIDEIILRLPAEIAKLNKAYTISLSFDELPAEEDNLLVFGNEELLFTAIKNIVANACKYSENHRATVKLTVKPEVIVIAVEDNGIGIPHEDLEHIFQPFFRVDENRSAGGFGLGLSLAHRIIKLHKGDIKVSSTVGKGSLFMITLPPAGRL